jgi:hypothetical protein
MNRHRAERAGDATFVESPAIATGHNLATERVPQYSAQPTEEEIRRLSHVQHYGANVSKERLDNIDSHNEKHDAVTAITINEELVETSQYPEVDAATEPTDDPSLPAGTFRAWFLGFLFVIVGSGMNLIFSLREPSIAINSLVAQLCAYPLGVGMAKILPKREWNVFGYRFSLNPGPFNKKEHAIIVIMANVTFGGSAQVCMYYSLRHNLLF